MKRPGRRSQKERREDSIARLLDATIHCLAVHGDRETSISRICARASLSQGGLFRHFPSRTALIAAAAHEVARRHLQQLEAVLNVPSDSEARIDALILGVQTAARGPLTAAWREVLNAARTHPELREAVVPAVRNYEAGVLAIAAQMPGSGDDPESLGILLLSLLHVFDSEATVAGVFSNEKIEHARRSWAAGQLKAAIERHGPDRN